VGHRRITWVMLLRPFNSAKRKRGVFDLKARLTQFRRTQAVASVWAAPKTLLASSPKKFSGYQFYGGVRSMARAEFLTRNFAEDSI